MIDEMTKCIASFFCLFIIICACNNQSTENENIVQKSSVIQDSAIHNGLYGTWARHSKEGFSLIEIKDTANVLYYQFYDHKSYNDTIRNDRYWYYKSTAKMGYWDSNTIWISTDKFRFDYKLRGDTLIEFDKMGEQGNFVKVYTDEQKAFIRFNAAIFKGEITYLNKVDSLEFFVLNNLSDEFSFTSIPDKNSDNKQFTDLAAPGDSVIKTQLSDTLILIKKQTNKTYKFGFVREFISNYKKNHPLY